MGMLIGIVAGAALLAVLAVLAVFDSSHSGRITEGVKVGRVDVGGLRMARARERVQRALRGEIGRPVTATYAGQRYTLADGARLDAEASVEEALERSREGSFVGRALRDLFGGEVDATVPPRIVVDRAAVDGWVRRIAERVDRPARDADIEFRDGKLRRTRARSGLTLRTGALARTVEQRLATASPQRTLEAPVEVGERPDRTLADLARRYRTVVAIDRDAKVLRLYKRLRLARRYTIAVGKQGLESAAGRYEITDKQVDPAWHVPMSDWAGDLAGKVIPPGDPRNPLVARWMGYHDGEGIHGTDDIESLGTAASHGCIRMSPTAVVRLYRQVDVGTPVFLQ